MLYKSSDLMSAPLTDNEMLKKYKIKKKIYRKYERTIIFVPIKSHKSKKMKNPVKLSLLGLSSACLVFIACQKKAVQNPATNQAASQSNVNSNIASKPIEGANSTHWSDGWCRNPANNCKILDEIVIIKPKYDLLKQAILNGSSTDVGDAFSSSGFANIVSGLPSEMVSSLQSGNYYLAISNEDDTKVCYIAGMTNPVSAANLDFAFQLAKQ